MDRDVAKLIARVREGDRGALDELVPIAYAKLHKIASGYLRRERPNHTLQPTALINAVYLRLLGHTHSASRSQRTGLQA